jgi:hypothetical protein
MGLKEIFSKISEKKKEEKEEYKRMERELRYKKLLEEKQKTPAQKELEFYQKEKDRGLLNERLKLERKIREEKMKNLNNPFNKPSMMERNSIMGGGLKLR